MSKFCKYCNYWNESYKTLDGRMGVCRNDQVIASIEKDTNITRADDGVLHTNENFGCIYFRKEDMNVATFSNSNIPENPTPGL
jgi:hypothetical protein